MAIQAGKKEIFGGASRAHGWFRASAMLQFGRLGRYRGGGGGRKEVAAADKSEDAAVDSLV
ncbi:hypothetical protein ACP70R_014234 [Stipagrostis hirtigluma subsp. patula]